MRKEDYVPAPVIPTPVVEVDYGQPVMSSVRVAEKTGKEHKHVLRDIGLMFESLGIDRSRFGQVEIMGNSQERPYYNLPEKLVMCLISGYSIPLRMAVLDELEATKKENVSLKQELSGSKLPQMSQLQMISAIAQETEKVQQQLNEVKDTQNTITEQLVKVSVVGAQQALDLKTIEGDLGDSCLTDPESDEVFAEATTRAKCLANGEAYWFKIRSAILGAVKREFLENSGMKNFKNLRRSDLRNAIAFIRKYETGKGRLR